MATERYLNFRGIGYSESIEEWRLRIAAELKEPSIDRECEESARRDKQKIAKLVRKDK